MIDAVTPLVLSVRAQVCRVVASGIYLLHMTILYSYSEVFFRHRALTKRGCLGVSPDRSTVRALLCWEYDKDGTVLAADLPLLCAWTV